MTQATAIGLFRHSPIMPSPSDMMNVYRELERLLNRLGAIPNWFLADDGVGRGGYKKYGGAFHKKVLERNTTGFRSVGLAAAPPDSDAPGYDSFVSASFIFSPEASKVAVNLVAHAPYLVQGSSGCDEIIGELARLWTWDYGFGFGRDLASDPEVYLVGGGSSRHSPEDERRTGLWYETSHDFYKGIKPPRRLYMIRDIFPYNMIGSSHLDHRLRDGRDLRAFIETDPDSALGSLTENLWIWKIRPDRTEVVRDRLLGAGIIICE